LALSLGQLRACLLYVAGGASFDPQPLKLVQGDSLDVIVKDVACDLRGGGAAPAGVTLRAGVDLRRAYGSRHAVAARFADDQPGEQRGLAV
jgi:hypothetical protein